MNDTKPVSKTPTLSSGGRGRWLYLRWRWHESTSTPRTRWSYCDLKPSKFRLTQDLHRKNYPVLCLLLLSRKGSHLNGADKLSTSHGSSHTAELRRDLSLGVLYVPSPTSSHKPVFFPQQPALTHQSGSAHPHSPGRALRRQQRQGAQHQESCCRDPPEDSRAKSLGLPDVSGWWRHLSVSQPPLLSTGELSVCLFLTWAEILL